MADQAAKKGVLHRLLLGLLQARREVVIVYALALATFLLFFSGPIGLGEEMVVETPLGSHSGVFQLVSYGQSFNFWFSFIALAVLFFVAAEMWSQLRSFYHAAQARGAYEHRDGRPVDKAYFDDLLYLTIKRTVPLFAFLLVWGIVGNIGQWWFYSGQFLTGQAQPSLLMDAPDYRNFTIDWTLGYQIANGSGAPAWKVLSQIAFSFVNWVYFGFFWAFVLTIPILMNVALLVLRDATYVGAEDDPDIKQVVFMPKERKLELVIFPMRRFVRLGLMFTLIAIICFYCMAAYYSYQWECQRGIQESQAATAHCANIQAFGRQAVASFVHVTGIDRALQVFDLNIFPNAGGVDEASSDLPGLFSTSQHRFSTLFPWFSGMLVVLFLGVQFLATDFLGQVRAYALQALDEPDAAGRLSQAARDDVRDALNELEVNPLGGGRSILFFLSLGAVAMAASVYYKVGFVFFSVAAAYAVLLSLTWFRRVNLVG